MKNNRKVNMKGVIGRIAVIVWAKYNEGSHIAFFIYKIALKLKLYRLIE